MSVQEDRDGGRYSVEELTEVKRLTIRKTQLPLPFYGWDSLLGASLGISLQGTNSLE